MDVEPPSPPEPEEESSASTTSPGLTLYTVSTIVTLVVALCAIGLSVWEGYEYRRHNRLSVMPQLQSANEYRNNPGDSTAKVRYRLLNAGLGPAVLESIVVYYDSTEVFYTDDPDRWLDFGGLRDSTQQLPAEIGLFTYSRRPGEMLKAGEAHLLFEATVDFSPSDSATLDGARQFRRLLNRYSHVFCYCSVYGDHCGQVIAKGYGYAPDDACGF